MPDDAFGIPVRTVILKDGGIPPPAHGIHIARRTAPDAPKRIGRAVGHGAPVRLRGVQ